MTLAKYFRKKIVKITLYATALVVACMQVPSPLAFAASNILYVTPSSSQMNIGTSFTVNIKAYTDTNASTMSVSGTVTYNPSLIQVTSTSTSGTDFGSPTISLGSGTVGFNGTRSSGQSSLSQIFSITFQAKGAGTANVGFNSNSRINGDATTYKTAAFTVTNPNPTPVKSTTPVVSTPPKTTTTSPVTSTAPTTTDSSDDSQDDSTADSSGIVDSVVVTPAYNSATITWNVDATNANSTIAYGSSSTQLDKQGIVKKTGTTSFSTAITGLAPGEQYYFSISGSGTGVQTGTYSATILTEGYPITITVTENKVVAANAQIQIGSDTYTTHSDGKVTIGLAAGSYSGTITTDTATLSINLTITDKTIPADGSAPEAQTASFNLTSSPLSSGPGSTATVLKFIAILFGGATLLIFGMLIFINYRRHKFDTTSDIAYSSTNSSSVIIDDGYTWHQDTAQASPTTELPPVDTEAADDSPHHANSVYLSEDEPLDMFEQAKLASADHGAAGQTPSSPHSTTP